MARRTQIIKAFISVFFGLLLWADLAVAGAQHHQEFIASYYELPETAKSEDLREFIYIWKPPASATTLADAKAAFDHGDFSINSGNLNRGFSDDAYWFYVGIYNKADSGRQVLLENDYPMLDTVEIYCAAGSHLQYYLVGDHTTPSSRPLQLRNFVVPLEIQANQLASCFFRVNSSSNIALPLSVSDSFPYLEAVHDSQWLLGAFYGIAFGLLLFCMVLLFALREPLYLFFAIHCFGGIWFNAGLDGSLTPYLYPLGMQDIGVLLAVEVAQLGALLFALSFLRVKRFYPRVYKYSLAGVFLSLLYMLLTFFVDTAFMSELIVTTGFLFLWFILLLGIISLKTKHHSATLFLLGWGPIIVAAMLVALTVLGVLQDSAISVYGMKAAWCLELVVFGIGLGWRMRTLKQAHLINERQMLDARRESLDKTQFLAKVSHEVRGPMTGILGLSELLNRTDLSDEQRRYIKAIRNGSQALLEVTNDFLDYSKIEAGKLSLSVQVFDLKDLVKDCAAIYEMAARQKGLRLVCIFEIGTPVVVEGDGGRVRQVLLNLMSNALKYTDVGYIKIRIGLTDQILDQQIVLKISVEDTGVGISEKDVERLFQNYSQINVGTNQDTLGTGLGLVISRQLVELMGGEIRFDSEFGKGSTFWFTLPVAIHDDYEFLDHEEIFNLIVPTDSDVNVPVEYSQKDIASQVVSLNDVAGREMEEGEPEAIAIQQDETIALQQEDHQLSVDLNILVVEDNEINLKVIRGFLDQLGLKPVTLNNGLEAVKNVTEGGQRYDLILMDCEMPVMDGYQAARTILDWEEAQGLEQTPIVALSAHAADIHRQKALEAGMIMHIPKPLTFEKFTEAIDIVLGV